MIADWALLSPSPAPLAFKKPGELIVIALDSLPGERDYVRRGYAQTLVGQTHFG